MSTTNDCSIDGQDDIYGVGVRVGLYVQWFATVLAYLFEPTEVMRAVSANYFFAIAVGICALVYRSAVYSHEILIVAMLLMLPPTVIVVSLLDLLAWNVKDFWNKPKPVTNTAGTQNQGGTPDPTITGGTQTTTGGTQTTTGGTQTTTGGTQILPTGQPYTDTATQTAMIGEPMSYTSGERLRDLAAVAATGFLLALAVWELFDGVDAADHKLGCVPKFFRSEYLAGVYNTILKVTSIIFAVIAPLGLLLRMVLKDADRGRYPEPGIHSAPGAPLPRTHSFANTRSPFRSDTPGVWHLNPRSIVAFVWGLFACFVIAEIEMVIKQNQIRGMYNPTKAGQIIPLVIGILQFLTVTYEYWIDPKHQKNGGGHGPAVTAAPPVSRKMASA